MLYKNLILETKHWNLNQNLEYFFSIVGYLIFKQKKTVENKFNKIICVFILYAIISAYYWIKIK